MYTATRFEFDIVAENAFVRHGRPIETRAVTLPSPEQAAAAYRQTANLCAAHASLMPAIW